MSRLNWYHELSDSLQQEEANKKNEQDKEKTLNNLRNLKGNSECNGISITEDYTVPERQMIKEFLIKAEKKNSLKLEKSNFVWKVWEIPKNGLVLKMDWY